MIGLQPNCYKQKALSEGGDQLLRTSWRFRIKTAS